MGLFDYSVNGVKTKRKRISPKKTYENEYPKTSLLETYNLLLQLKSTTDVSLHFNIRLLTNKGKDALSVANAYENYNPYKQHFPTICNEKFIFTLIKLANDSSMDRDSGYHTQIQATNR